MHSECNVIFNHYQNKGITKKTNKETLGPIDEKGEDQIPNNNVGEEVHVDNSGERILNAGR